MSEAALWLPAGTDLPASVATALAARIEAWSSRWFVADAPRLHGTLARSSAAPLDGLAWEASGAVAIGRSAETLAALGALVLDVPVPKAPGDGEVIERVAHACLDELKTSLASFAGEEGAWQPVSMAAAFPYRAELVATSRQLRLRLGLSGDGFARLVRNSLPPVTRPPLDRIAPAIAQVQASLGVRIGASQLTLEEFAALAPGDVVLLDTGLDAALSLTLDGAAATKGSARLSDTDDHYSLKIVEPLV